MSVLDPDFPVWQMFHLAEIASALVNGQPLALTQRSPDSIVNEQKTPRSV